jgi:hypothetical protein
LYFQVWQKVQVLAHDLGIKGSTIEIFAVINQLILAYRFIFQNDIIGVEENQQRVSG